MRSQSFEGIEMNGALLEAHVKAFHLFPSRALSLLAQNGIGTKRPDGQVAIDYSRWYPLDAWLKAFDAILESVGPNVVFNIGEEVPKHAQLPPDVKDVHGSIRAVDVGYHMNHRKQGRIMFDPATGNMTEGIGHYGYESKGPRKIVSVCENPFPCPFDRGVITCFARKFEPGALVTHMDVGPCRAKGGPSCSYTISW